MEAQTEKRNYELLWDTAFKTINYGLLMQNTVLDDFFKVNISACTSPILKGPRLEERLQKLGTRELPYAPVSLVILQLYA